MLFKFPLSSHPVAMMSWEDILRFWFEELSEWDWFAKDDDIDDMMRGRFSTVLKAAEKGELFEWRGTAEGRLAEIILLDQFSRNIYRGTPDSFKNDSLALVLSQELLFNQMDKLLETRKRIFAYMPFMHSESRVIHEIALKLFGALGEEESLKYEVLHKEIIDRFGRFPHRNKILGRVTTPKEFEFLQGHPGF